MVQQPNFTATNTARDITAGLVDGCFVAQVSSRSRPINVVVLFATAPTAPSNDDVYFEAPPGAAFSFSVGPGISPTWVKRTLESDVDPGAVFDLNIAIARTS